MESDLQEIEIQVGETYTTYENSLSENVNENDNSKIDAEQQMEFKICTKCEELLKEKDALEQHLNETRLAHQKFSDENNMQLKQLEEKCMVLEVQLENSIKQRDMAQKEKEAMVIRYAVGEKNVLKEKQQKESFEKKFKEQVRENEILQHKVQTMMGEKSRICQMLDNKCYEYRTVQQELDRTKTDLNALETKLKWSQNSLKTEIANHKECQIKADSLNQKLQEITSKTEQVKRDAEESIIKFQNSEDNRAHVLEQQLKEVQASLILFKHERNDRVQQVKTLQSELERLQAKQMDMLHENNELSVKVQQLELDRLETEQKLRELRGCADQQRQDAANLQAQNVEIEQLKLQLKHAQDQLSASNEQISIFKQRNTELESDMESCRVREAEMLVFTQQLTDKNVRLQSEFTAMETKVQQLTTDQTLVKRLLKEHETKTKILTQQLDKEREKNREDKEMLMKQLEEITINCERFKQEAIDQKGENAVIKRKLELSLREVSRELQHCRKKLDNYEQNNIENTSSSSSSSSNIAERVNSDHSAPEQVKVLQPDTGLDRQTLIEHIVKLQRISAKKSEKLDFLEEHVNTLVLELQKKSRLLQSYILREQTGTVTSNVMDNNKAKLAKLNGVMASMYSSRVVDDNLTLELSLDINRKLQAVLEDTLLKNMTLKENVDTLGSEIDRLSKLLKAT